MTCELISVKCLPFWLNRGTGTLTRNRQKFMRRSPKSGWITPRTLGENLLIIACVTAWDQTQCKIVPSIFNIRLESSSSDKNQFSSLSHQENPGMNDHTAIPKTRIWSGGGLRNTRFPDPKSSSKHPRSQHIVDTTRQIHLCTSRQIRKTNVATDNWNSDLIYSVYKKPTWPSNGALAVPSRTALFLTQK